MKEIDELVASRRPLLVGVRHHSAALAAALPALLEAFGPTEVLLELPADLGGWLPWLGAPDLEAPVALSALAPDGTLAFYPFADFSPELAAIRWARRAGVPVVAIDRPVAARQPREDEDEDRGTGLVAHLSRRLDGEDPWDTLVEARAPADPETLRRAALAFGWLHRQDALAAGPLGAEDTAREQHMRAAVAHSLASEGARVAAVVGAFHAAALRDVPPARRPPEAAVPAGPLPGALVPYDFELLDARSGYPAGVLDPALAQRAFALYARGEALDAALPALLVEIARALRAKGHVASFADVREALRLARDLAILRGLASPGRRELLEALTTTLGQGEPLGRGRVLAAALEAVLVGQRRGRLPAGAPRSGLVVAAEAELAALGLPGPATKDAREITLDPHRTDLDRRRATLLGRLDAAGIPYAEALGGRGAGARGAVTPLTVRVRLAYTPATAARLELAARFGATPRAAAEGLLRRELARLRDGEAGADAWLALTSRAATAGLPGLVDDLLARLPSLLLPTAGLAELVEALGFVARLDDGQIATLAPGRALGAERELLVLATRKALEGLAGSTREDDVRAIAELVAILGPEASAALGIALDALADAGSPLVRGAAAAGRALTGREPVERFAAALSSWLDHGGDDAAAAAWRTAVLRGALLLAGPILEGDPRLAAALVDGVDRLPDDRFLARLPSLRDGFEVLSAADRGRLLDALGLGPDALATTIAPDLQGMLASADAAARDELRALDLDFPAADRAAAAPAAAPAERAPRAQRIGLADRLRLLLGRERAALPATVLPYALALEALYGHGHGEGSRAGTEGAYPTARDWADELGALFGAVVREEVLGRAAAAGDAAALALLDPNEVVPSVTLLERILALKGGLAERDLAHLRRLARRVIDALAAELRTQLAPALRGLSTPRPTRRRGGPLDLRRTVERNLATARPIDGTLRLVPRSLTFKTRASPSLDWRIVFVVDVSGSMDRSMIHAALMAAILAGLPAITTHFLAINERVVDLSAHVTDPLELLLSVRIGGGTILGRGLRHARELVRVPARTLVFLLTDFEEGASVPDLLAEVRALVDEGVTALGLAALDGDRAPRYNRAVAEQVAAAGMPVAALGPNELARWVGDRLRGAQ